jgi:hypothetical protein
MKWNWQQPDWPDFSWDESRLRKAEEHFLVGTGMLTGTLKHLPQSEQEQLTIESISAEAAALLKQHPVPGKEHRRNGNRFRPYP